MASNQLNYKEAALESCAKLCDWISEVGNDPFLESRLALSGESAIQLCFGEPHRLPQSIAYYFLSDHAEADLERDQAECTERLKLIGQELGATEEVSDKKDRLTLKCTFPSIYKPSFTLPVTVEWTERLPMSQPESSKSWVPKKNGTDLSSHRVLRICNKELVATTLFRSLSQTSCDTIQDLTNLQAALNEEWLDPTIRRAFIWMSIDLPRPISSYSVERFSQISQRELDYKVASVSLGGIAPRVRQIIAAGKQALAPFLKLDEAETEFLKLWSEGIYRPEILFVQDADLLERVQSHPQHILRVQSLQAS